MAADYWTEVDEVTGEEIKVREAAASAAATSAAPSASLQLKLLSDGVN